jgi:hypothetical protein
MRFTSLLIRTKSQGSARPAPASPEAYTKTYAAPTGLRMKDFDGARYPYRIGLGFAIMPRWGSDRRQHPRVQQKMWDMLSQGETGRPCAGG